MYCQVNASYSTWHDCFSGTNGCEGHGLAGSESRHEPYGTPLGTNGGVDPVHG